MEERENVEILFLGNITHQNENPGQSSDKMSYQDQISFADPVQVELLRIPSNGKQMYSRLISQTQKQPIKSLQIYYRNLDKKSARYSLMVCSSSELLVSSSTDILMTLPETIFTDLLVIRGNFTNITFCIYGRVLRSKQEIQKKCPYFINNIEVLLREEQPSIKMNRNVFNESRTIVKAIQDEYSETRDQVKLFNWDTYSNDRQTCDTEVKHVCRLIGQLLSLEQFDEVQQKNLGTIRERLQNLSSYLSKLFKSAHIGLYYPTPYRQSTIPEVISLDIIRMLTRLLGKHLSDQYRTLDVLKLILQLGPHAQYFVNLGGIDSLIRLFLWFFCSDYVILSTLKSSILQVFIVLSFWNFSATKLVDKLPKLFQQTIAKSNSQIEKQQDDDPESPKRSVSRSKSESRSRDKKKKKQISPSKQDQKGDKKKSKKQKQKKSKKNKDRERSKSRSKDRERQKDKRKDKNRSSSKQKQKQKQKEKQKQKQKQKQKEKQKFDKPKKQQKMQTEDKIQSEEVDLKQKISECSSFYEIIFILIRYEKNSKLQLLMKIFLQQITQTLTKNVEVSNEMAYYTPLLRDTKYMFNQGGEMINSKSLKVFAFFQPFLNSQQSKDVDSPFICQKQKIKQPKKYNIPPKLFKLIDTAITVFQSKSQDQAPVMFDEQFMTLVSALIQNNKNGVAIGLNNFIQAIKIDTLLGLKKQQAVVAIICEYIHEVFIQDQGMNIIYYLDQIHTNMLKIINWLKEDRTFSLQIKRKVQYLINSCLVYNYFSSTQNNFKNFSEYFIKLIGHQNLDINKILDYSRKQEHKTVNPLSYLNLSENFSLGNFYDVLPAQPLLQVDICLRLFLSIVKFNKNIWTVFYQYKFVPAFATLYLKLHSLLKFFLTPSLQRQNALIQIKMHERIINNYLQVARHLTAIFICKWRYQSAFNQLTQQQDIFNSVQLYEKWADTYIFLFNAIHTKDFVISAQKTVSRIKDLFANFVQLFEVILKGYQLTKHSDRQRNIKSLLKYIYRQHYQSISNRSGILSILSLFINISGTHTSQMIIEYLLDKNPKIPTNNYDILLPQNQKSIFQNILRRNIYRSDSTIAENLSKLIQQLLGHEKFKQKVYQILENILDENQAHQKQDFQQLKYNSITIEKSTLYTNILSFVKAPMNAKIEQHLLRLLKSTLNIRYPSNQDQMRSFQLRRLKLRNSYLNFFKTAIKYNNNFNPQLYQQFLKLASTFLQAQLPQSSSKIRLQELNGISIILSGLQLSCSNLTFQSILLFGEFTEKPTKAACELNLQKIISHIKQSLNKNKNNQMMDESQFSLFKQISLSLVYMLCQLTTIDGAQFYSTQIRKIAINTLISPQKSLNLSDVIAIMQEIVPKKFLLTLKNYLDFPIVQKPQIISSLEKQNLEKKTMGYLYSKGVFTMISQNDPVGKARFELIQDRWVGGEVQGQLFKVNTPLHYNKIASQRIIKKNLQIQYIMTNQQHNKLKYEGIHIQKQVNSLFSFKIRKIFTQDTKKNTISANRSILIKNIPPEIKRPQISSKQSYQNKMNTSPSLSRHPSITSQQNNTNGGSTIKPPLYNPSPQTQPPPVVNPMRASSSNNRQASPYNPQQIYTPSKPTYNPPITQTYAPPMPTVNPAATNPNPYYSQKNSGVPYTPPIPKTYPPTTYEQPMPVYDPRSYYPPVQTYDPRTGASYPPNYIVHNNPHPSYPPRVMPQQGYPPNPYNTPAYIAPPRPSPPVKGVQSQVNEAINTLMFLQQNPNYAQKEQLKSKVNKLFQIPGVHEKVSRYFEDIKRN